VYVRDIFGIQGALVGDRTGIEWTDTTWNPVTGCTKVSPGCDHCYAATFAERRLRDVYTRRLPVVDTAENRADPFAVRLWPDRLDYPLAWSEPRMIFVNSMSDLFHSDIPVEFVRDVFEVMLTADWHVYQVLTKRPARAAAFWTRHALSFGLRWIPEHIWVGTSIEDENVLFRVRHLRSIRARVRFLSCEPLLGPLNGLELEGMSWVIGGGESGADARPVDASWALELRNRCVDAGVPFFWKQWGGRTSKSGGRMLDGRTWDEYPELTGIRARQA
jgi:protein gp37